MWLGLRSVRFRPVFGKTKTDKTGQMSGTVRPIIGRDPDKTGQMPIGMSGNVRLTDGLPCGYASQRNPS